MMKKNRIMALLGLMCLQAGSMNAMQQQTDPFVWHKVIFDDNTEELQKLIAQGIYENALQYAIDSNAPNSVRMLIEAGADVNANKTLRGGRGVISLEDLLKENMDVKGRYTKFPGAFGWGKYDWRTPRAFITSVSPKEIALGLPAVLKKKVALAEKLLPAKLYVDTSQKEFTTWKNEQGSFTQDWEDEVTASFKRVSQAQAAQSAQGAKPAEPVQSEPVQGDDWNWNQAIILDNTKELKELIDQKGANAKTEGYPVLWVATIIKQKPNAVKALIEAGADVDVQVGGKTLSQELKDMMPKSGTLKDLKILGVLKAFITSVSPKEIVFGLGKVLEKKEALAKQVLPPQVQNLYNEQHWENDVKDSFNRLSQAQAGRAILQTGGPIRPGSLNKFLGGLQPKV